MGKAFAWLMHMWNTKPRDLDTVELCSGRGVFSWQARARGLRTWEVDRFSRRENKNLTRLAGVVWAGVLVLRRKPA
eukprot:12369703-Alexandrium_andersonii.AAC.1